MGCALESFERKGRYVIMNGQNTTIAEKDEAHGLINARDFGGDQKMATCYTLDATGHTMLYAVANEAMKRNVVIHDKKEAISIITQNDQCLALWYEISKRCSDRLCAKRYDDRNRRIRSYL